MIRDDLSDKLVHLTKGDPDQIAANAFLSILHEKKLKGGISNNKSQHPCVCFSEAPLSKLGHILSSSSHAMRYKPFGIMVSKNWLYGKGGRPVIYQHSDEYRFLPSELQYRHVRYEPPAIDFTWEREWRIPVDQLEIEPVQCAIIVPNRKWEDWFLDKHAAAVNIGKLVTHGFGLSAKQPWHFVVLEDLGVPIPAVDPPKNL